jgi:hypothetical protein
LSFIGTTEKSVLQTLKSAKPFFNTKLRTFSLLTLTRPQQIDGLDHLLVKKKFERQKLIVNIPDSERKRVLLIELCLKGLVIRRL